MRINTVITKGNMYGPFNKISQGNVRITVQHSLQNLYVDTCLFTSYGIAFRDGQ